MSRPSTWSVQPIGSGWRINGPGLRTGTTAIVADVHPRPRGQGLANALLIGAAPELAASLSAGLTADDLDRIADHLPARLHELAERFRTRATAERLALSLAGLPTRRPS